jgi:hypothetical protein
MGWTARVELRIEDGSIVRGLDGDELHVLLASGPLPRDGEPTATFVSQAPAEDDPVRLLALLDDRARGHRLLTAAAVRWRGDELHVAWVGDVRGHLLRLGSLIASTRDHTLERDLGVTVPGALLDRVTTRSLGGPDARAEVESWSTGAADTLVLCAPHLHDFRRPGAYLADALDLTCFRAGRIVITRQPRS